MVRHERQRAVHVRLMKLGPAIVATFAAEVEQHVFIIINTFTIRKADEEIDLYPPLHVVNVALSNKAAACMSDIVQRGVYHSARYIGISANLTTALGSSRLAHDASYVTKG